MAATLTGAALEMARGSGPDAVRLREVARIVGVSPPAVYRHFASRQQLLDSVRHEARSELRAMAAVRASELTEVMAPDGAGERATSEILALCTAYIRTALAEPGLFRVAFLRGAADEPLPDGESVGCGLFTTDLRESVLALVGERLEILVRDGVLAPEHRAAAEAAVLSTTHGLALLLTGPMIRLPAGERNTVADGALAIIVDGITRPVDSRGG